MKVFRGFNQGDICPICNTNKDQETVLIGVVGTEDDGNMQAKAVHLACIELLWYDQDGEIIIAMKIK